MNSSPDSINLTVFNLDGADKFVHHVLLKSYEARECSLTITTSTRNKKLQNAYFCLPARSKEPKNDEKSLIKIINLKYEPLLQKFTNCEEKKLQNIWGTAFSL